MIPIGLFRIPPPEALAALMTLIQRKVAVRAAVVINAPPDSNASIDALEHATTEVMHGRRTRGVLPRLGRDSHAKDIAAGDPAMLIIQGAARYFGECPWSGNAGRCALRPFYHRTGPGPALEDPAHAERRPRLDAGAGDWRRFVQPSPLGSIPTCESGLLTAPYSRVRRNRRPGLADSPEMRCWRGFPSAAGRIHSASPRTDSTRIDHAPPGPVTDHCAGAMKPALGATDPTR